MTARSTSGSPIKALVAAALIATSATAPAAAREDVSEDARALRRAIDEDLLDEPAYDAFVAALAKKGWLDDPSAFRRAKDLALRPGETVAHHRLAAALERAGRPELAPETEPYLVTHSVPKEDGA